jgi:DnaD and phage-associated domain
MINGRSLNLSPRTEFTPVPDALFTQVMPTIQDLAELKVMLYILYLLRHKQGQHLQSSQQSAVSKLKAISTNFVTYKELLSLSPLMAGMEEQELQRALRLAEKHGIISRADLNIDGKPEEAYFINTESELKAIGQDGKLLAGKIVSRQNIFTLYEQNIGIITPMIAEELKEAERLYSAQWIGQAFREAVMMNKRSWRYIVRILERWASEGKESGGYRKSTKESDPDKYIKGKYGHLVKR